MWEIESPLFVDDLIREFRHTKEALEGGWKKYRCTQPMGAQSTLEVQTDSQFNLLYNSLLYTKKLFPFSWLRTYMISKTRLRTDEKLKFDRLGFRVSLNFFEKKKKNGIKDWSCENNILGIRSPNMKMKRKGKKRNFWSKKNGMSSWTKKPENSGAKPFLILWGGQGKTIGNEHVKFSPLLFSSPPSSLILYIVFLFLTPLPSTIYLQLAWGNVEYHLSTLCFTMTHIHIFCNSYFDLNSSRLLRECSNLFSSVSFRWKNPVFSAVEPLNWQWYTP